MFGNVALVMSFCGSVTFIGYLLLHPFIERYCSSSWSYRFLKISMVFYLFPFYMFHFRYWIEEIFGIETSAIALSSFADGSYILIQGENIQMSSRVFWTYVILIAFAICTFTILYWQIRRYFKLKKYYLQNVITEIPIHIEKHLQEAQKQVGVKKVRFVFSQQCFSPIAMGTISPIMILPFSMQEQDWDENYKFMILHELNHVKNHDLWIRFLALIVMAVHWFNPLSYLLFFEICNVSEFYCDACTIQGEDESGKKYYSRLILDMATEPVLEKRQPYIVSFISNNKKFMMKRIQKMKYLGKKNRWVSYLVALVLCVTGSAGALVYEAPTVVINEGEQITDWENIEMWDPEEFCEEDISGICPYIDTLIYSDGTMVDFSQYTMIQDSKAICLHSYEDATRVLHKKNSNGGCTVTYREVRVCRKCESYILGDITNEVHYKKCIH